MKSEKGRTLSGIRELLDSSANEFEVRYYMMEKEHEDNGRLYGVCVEKHEGDNGARALKERQEEYLTTDKEQIDKILDRLIGGSVTVCALTEVLDGLYDETI